MKYALTFQLSTTLHLLYIYQDDCGLIWGVLQAAGNPNAYDVTTWVRTCVEMLNIFFLRRINVLFVILM
jgi:hypothetical protein